MKEKTKKTKTIKTKTSPQRRKLNTIATKVRTILRRDTVHVVEIGKLLIQARGLLADEHGQWKPWLAKNFDMSYRTAVNYCSAAEYVARKNATVALFRNIAPGVLYDLAASAYEPKVEAAILADAKAGRRVDQGRADEICKRLAPPPPAADDGGDVPGDDAADDAGDDAADDAADDDDGDREIGELLDGPPPELPETEQATPCNYALRDFDQAIAKLKQIMTKPAKHFIGTEHTTNDLVHVETFIQQVCKEKRFAPLEDNEDSEDKAA